MKPWYCTRDDVVNALDTKVPVSMLPTVDRVCDSASRMIEDLCHRQFYPVFKTYKHFPWPRRSKSFRVWTGDVDVLEIETLRIGGDLVDSADIILQPLNYGPPFNRIELNPKGSTTAFYNDGDHIKPIEVFGTFGYDKTERQVSSISSAAAVDADRLFVADSSKVSVGSVFVVGSEYMIATDRAFREVSGVTVSTGLVDKKNDDQLVLSSVSGFYTNEIVRVGSELMRIVGVASGSLTVQRAVFGSVLASHSSGAVVSKRDEFSVLRGELGTAAVSIAADDVLKVWEPPAPVRSLAIAEAVNLILQESSGYARVVGSGENAREMRGSGLKGLRMSVQKQYGRSGRVRAVG